jgi:hypothetical protein
VKKRPEEALIPRSITPDRNRCPGFKCMVGGSKSLAFSQTSSSCALISALTNHIHHGGYLIPRRNCHLAPTEISSGGNAKVSHGSRKKQRSLKKITVVQSDRTSSITTLSTPGDNRVVKKVLIIAKPPELVLL